MRQKRIKKEEEPVVQDTPKKYDISPRSIPVSVSNASTKKKKKAKIDNANTMMPVSETVNILNDLQKTLFRRRLMGEGAYGETNSSPLTRDYAAQFGYPEYIDKFMYQRMYDRDPVAHRIVELYPAECWQQLPAIYDSDSPTDSEFEKQVNILFRRFSIWSMLRRVDVLSGIGNFGILLMGVGDGRALNEPIEYDPEHPENYKYDLQYIRAFPHSQVSIIQSEGDKTNPRYGHPTMYRIEFQPAEFTDIEGFVDMSMQEVHWSRIIHITDNREVSEIYGVPRLQVVYNTLLDLSKVVGSSGEMFYKGAYPGFVVESSDNLLGTVQIDTEALRAEIEKFENNFQRWMTLKNAHVNPLSSQYSDPSGHSELCLDRIAVALGCPLRILKGSERGELASSQDAVLWNKRVMERQTTYVTPYIIRPVVQFLIRYGMVPMPYDKDFHVEWPDLSCDTNEQVYQTRDSQLRFLQTYKEAQLNEFFAPIDFLMKFCDMSEQEASSFLTNAEKYNRENIDRQASFILAQQSAMGGLSGGEEGGGDMGGLGGGGGMPDLGGGGMPDLGGGGMPDVGGGDMGGGEAPPPM